MSNIIFRTVVGFLAAALVLPASALASNDPAISLISRQAPDGSATVTVELSTADTSLNAIEGVLVYPKNEVVVKEILDGDSIISFWIQQPALQSTGGEVAFKGLAAGGLSTLHGKLFQVIFTSPPNSLAKNVFSKIEIKKARGYLNDGHGTPVPMTGGSLLLAVPGATSVSSTAVSSTPESVMPTDSHAPHDLIASVSRYVAVFDNQWFLVFTARDDASGIFGYEVQESRTPTPIEGSWITAQSPYVLHDQSRESYIHVRVFDKAKNSSVVTLAPEPHSPQIYTNLKFWCILLLIIGIVLGGNVWRKKISRTQLPQ